MSCVKCLKQSVNIFEKVLQHQWQQLLIIRLLWLGNIYEGAIGKLRAKTSRQFMWFNDGNAMWHKETHNSEITRTRRMLVMEIFGLLFFFFWGGLFQSPSRFTQTLSSGCLVPFCVSCSLLKGSSLGSLDASAASRSVSRHSWERSCCLSWQLFGCPRGPDRLLNLSSWKSQPDGGRDVPASGNLTTCLPSPSLLLFLPFCGPHSLPAYSRGNYIGQRVG